MMDDAVAVGPQSIFVVVSWGSALPCCMSILQLETQKHDHQEAADYLTGRRRVPFSSLETQLNQKEYVAHFKRPPWSSMDWMVSLLTTTSSTQDLYLLPYQSHEADDVPLRASIFDFRTKTHRPISLPPFNINIQHVVSLGGCIYAISDAIMFMCYDPASGEWNHRQPFPGDADCIMATAVWEVRNTVLFNLGNGHGIWAYDVKTDKWCCVHVKTDKRWCYSIVGEAVVLENTIYALTKDSSDLLLALSIQREDGGDDCCRFVCSLRCQISLDIFPDSVLGARNRTRHLVHFGDDSFCLVQCGQDEYPDDYQPIQLTNIKLSEENSMMTVIDECVHLLRIPDALQFDVKLCFSLPECKTSAPLKQGKNICFNLDPYPKHFDPKAKFKTDDSYSEAEKEFETLPKDGRPLVNVLDTSKLSASSNATSKASTTLGNGATTETFGELKKFGASDKVSAIITEGCPGPAEMEEKTRIVSVPSIMDHARPPPLFVVLSYGGKAPYCASVVKLETPPVVAPPEPKSLQVNLQDNDHIVARFRAPPVCSPDTRRRLPEVRWLFSPPTVSTEDMYLVPDWESDFDFDNYSPPCTKPPLQGYKFNFRNGECLPIHPPRVPKSQGHVVNLKGHIYFMAHPDRYYDTPDPVFECYDGNRWKPLQPFPDHAVLLGRCLIQATAVLNDTILYNMWGRRIWAYHVTNDKWYLVHVEDDRCYDIVGEAVVLENNIVYALTHRFRASDYVLALSIQREETDDDGLVFTCSLHSAILVRGMGQIKYKRTDGFTNIRHLVHLGNDNFCLVQSCKFSNYLNANKYQPIQLTCLKSTGENSMTVTNTCVYEVEIQPENQFEVRLCFSLPEYKTTALKQGNRFLYNLDPDRGEERRFGALVVP